MAMRARRMMGKMVARAMVHEWEQWPSRPVSCLGWVFETAGTAIMTRGIRAW